MGLTRREEGRNDFAISLVDPASPRLVALPLSSCHFLLFTSRGGRSPTKLKLRTGLENSAQRFICMHVRSSSTTIAPVLTCSNMTAQTENVRAAVWCACSTTRRRGLLSTNDPYLQAGVAVLRKRGHRLDEEAGVDGLAQRVERFLGQRNPLTARQTAMTWWTWWTTQPPGDEFAACRSAMEYRRMATERAGGRE